MNSIALIILRGVVAGKVTLTPQVLGALKAVSQDHPRVDGPVNSANESATHTNESKGVIQSGHILVRRFQSA